MEHPLIHDRGRGPELVGTRTTIYNLVADFRDPNRTEAMIAEDYRLTSEQVAAMRAYFLHHFAEVMAVNEQIDERHRKGMEAQNTPAYRAHCKRVREDMEHFRVWLSKRDPSEVAADEAERGRAMRRWREERFGTADDCTVLKAR